MNEPRSDPAWRRQFHWAVLGDLGLVPAPDAQVLDFGCGAGEGVYQLRKAGVRAFGTDTRADWADCQRKHIDEALARAGEEVFRVTNTLPYRIPFDDDTFDLLLSDQDYAEVIAETHRVLKPGGVALHEFPARWNPIERHVFVPLAGVLLRHLWPMIRPWPLLARLVSAFHTRFVFCRKD